MSCSEFMQKRLAKTLGLGKTIKVSKRRPKEPNIQIGNKISI